MQLIELAEYESRRFPRNDLLNEDVELLWRKFRNQVSIETPSFKTDGQWELTAGGWAGFIPLTERVGISLKPKVPLANLFGMMDWAYRLRGLKFPSGLFHSDSLSEFYDYLVSILAKRILDRGRKGYYRVYLGRRDLLPHLRGRWDVLSHLRNPARIHLACEFEEHTPDIPENQILYWTLSRVVRSGLCSERTLPVARRAFRSLQGFAQLIHFTPADCAERLYNRLNLDYQPLHVLCRFFLEHSGPSHKVRDKEMIPFLIDMDGLYEKFVAEWLRPHLPPRFKLLVQDSYRTGEGDVIKWKVDLVLLDTLTGKPAVVMDTKYKRSQHPASDDIQQVVAYAEAKGCREAVLIYPSTDHQRIDERVGAIRVRSLVFSIADDLDKGGDKFLDEMLLSME